MGAGAWYHRGSCCGGAYGRQPKIGWCVKLQSRTASHGIAGEGKHHNRLTAGAERIGRTYSAVRSRVVRLRATSYRTR